jgi:ketosteroid isomerase-like protein
MSETCIPRYIEAYNRKDIDGMMACFTPDVVFRHIENGEIVLEISGIRALRKQAEQAAALFSERTQTLTTLTGYGDFWEASVHFRGTLASGPHAGQTIEVQGESRFFIENDLIAQLTDKM